MEERPPDARRHGRAARLHVPRAVGAGVGQLHPAPFEEGTPTVISQIGESVYDASSSAAGQDPVALAPGRHDAHPGAGGQHELRRLPPAGELPGQRQLPAPPAHQARPPPRLLQRHHRPRRRARSCCSSLTGAQVEPPHPALRHRGVPRLHPLAGRHGQAPPPPEARRAGAAAWPSTASARSCRWWCCSSSRITKFTDGAWVIIIVPSRSLVIPLFRLNKQYESRGGRARAGRARGGRGADHARATS